VLKLKLFSMAYVELKRVLCTEGPCMLYCCCASATAAEDSSTPPTCVPTLEYLPDVIIASNMDMYRLQRCRRCLVDDVGCVRTAVCACQTLAERRS
jgi:hypothetical protein